ncbi:MAG TPA: VOC family protein [Chloroflexota bacterium]|jgi:catechol 2,3-dioxygenase-like lactoylglutathione lyase family enzyme
MPILLDHQIIPVRDKEVSAAFLARALGLEAETGRGHFAVVRLSDGTVLDFETHADVQRLHLAFRVTEPEFDEILGRLQSDGVAYGSMGSRYDGQIKTDRPGRGVYFPDPCGHSWEVITQSYESQR